MGVDMKTKNSRMPYIPKTKRNLVSVGGFNNGNGVSNRLPEGISTKEVPNTSLHKLLLRLALEVRNEELNTSGLSEDYEHA